MTRLLASAHDGGDSGSLMRQVTDLQRHMQDVEAAIVARGRGRGDSWADICRATGRGAERMRKKWNQDAVARRLERARAARVKRSATASDTPLSRSPGNAGGPEAGADSPRPPSQTPAQQLAAAMSFLQRATQEPIKETALNVGISPSYLSRILAGTRRPSWPVVERFAAACHANLAELRDLWEAAQRPPDLDTPPREPAPHDPEEAKEKFHTALRALYLAADRPDLWAIQRITGAGKKLPIREITRTLNGSHIPDWESTARLVLALRGRPAELRPLWQAATTPPECADSPHLPAAAFG
ncbi:helix-turn-helix domain-containing protein [Streptomyces sp. NPDC000229]|uniref:helix-turn-helix domain-containing protein n=1 Tax=Streptomyces sp. NPDC000229 TaxID=3154247 RepID=UPI00331CB008